MSQIPIETSAGAQAKVDAHDVDGASHADIRALIGGGGSTPDATTSVKGKVKLAGDLSGTADLPTVPGLAAKADASATTSALAAKAADSAVVHNSGAEVVAGVKTFSSAPVVPSASFPESAVTNLTTDLAAKATDTAVVHNTGTETVAGVKTFSSSPVVPTPTTGTQAVNKTYADGLVAGGAPDATTGSKGIVQLAGDLAGTAALPTVPGLAGKAATSHTHAESDVTNLASDLAGKAATSHTHAASDIASGTVATARLGSGSASSSTFLRGDQTWATPAGGGGGLGLVTTGLKTSAYTAVSGDMIPCNTTSGTVPIQLPIAAASLIIGIRKSDLTANTVTIAAAGGDGIGDLAPVSSVSLSIPGQGYLLLGHTGGWTVVATSESLSQLDLRYAAAGGSANYGGVFGDGSDGSATLDGTATVAWASKSGSTYTLTRDCHTTALTINSGVTLIGGGARIFCQGTVTNAGTIHANGNAGLANGTVGAATATLIIGGGVSGSVGNVAAGSNGIAATVGAASGGAGGAGASGAGGAGGATLNSGSWMFKTPTALLSGVASWASVVKAILGGSGGGGGGGDSTNKGGGGGSGGGIVGILAHAVVNSGTISAVGGNGGTPVTGNGGGGGGGAGGLILVYTLSAWTAGTTAVTGGTGGSGVGTGVAGSTGGAGSVLNSVLV